MTKRCRDCEKVISKYKTRCLLHAAQFEIRRSQRAINRIDTIVTDFGKEALHE